MLASRLALDTDPNKNIALNIAASAWNQITSGTDALRSRGDATLFAVKQKGYDAIQRNDFLQAYYIFLKLHDQEQNASDGKKDPDVDRFLEVSRKGVLNSFFFADETVNKRLFESARDVFFTIRHPDGSSDVFFVRGITYTRTGGKDMAYLRGFELIRFGSGNTVLYRISVPYVKMLPWTTEAGRNKSEFLLRAVSRSSEGADVLPVVLAGRVPDQEKNILVLDLPYSDFNLLVTVNSGISTLSLYDLYRFADRAEMYGFSRNEYLEELTGRLADPFLILVLSIYALVLGWKYRLGTKKLFHAWWILVVPLFSLFAFYAIDTVRYLSRLCIIALVELVPRNPVLPMLGVVSLCFVAVSVYFFYQRS
jgi:hypothetical protein